MVKVSDKYFIKTEVIDYSAWSIEPSKKKDSDEIEYKPKLIGYYSSPYKAIEAIFNYEVHKSLNTELSSLYEAASVIKNIADDFRQYVNSIKEELKQ